MHQNLGGWGFPLWELIVLPILPRWGLLLRRGGKGGEGSGGEGGTFDPHSVGNRLTPLRCSHSKSAFCSVMSTRT